MTTPTARQDHAARYAQALAEAGEDIRRLAGGEAPVEPVHRFERSVTPVQSLRERLGFTQREFAERFGIPQGTLRNWEQGRREPEGSARVLLRLIEARPDVVLDVLGRRAPTPADDAAASTLTETDRDILTVLDSLTAKLSAAHDLARRLTRFEGIVRLVVQRVTLSDDLTSRPLRLHFMGERDEVVARCRAPAHGVFGFAPESEALAIPFELSRSVTVGAREPFSIFLDDALIGHGVVRRALS